MNPSLTSFIAAAAFSTSAIAAPAVYNIDPQHTFPSFEGDHFGLSVWRGKFTRTSGNITMDRTAGTGTVEVSIDATSIDFGLPAMTEHAVGTEFLDTKKFPQVLYKGKLAGFTNSAPSTVHGELTLHGVTRPVELHINAFKCMPHPMLKREVCGADALATFKRDDFGLSAGKDYGFNMEVTVRIQIEAIKAP